MLKKLVKKWRKAADRHKIFDPSQFRDPVAMQIEWTPVNSGGGANFRIHKLVEVDFNRLEFKATIGAWSFCLIFLIVGMWVSVGFSARRLLYEVSPFDTGLFMTILAGLIFIFVGGWMYYFVMAPIVFDKGKGCFWKSRKKSGDIFDKNFVKLQDIYALQLISKYVSGDDSYYSYELNIILGNGKRINVIDQGSPKKLRGDATILAAFLNKPLWDAM